MNIVNGSKKHDFNDIFIRIILLHCFDKVGVKEYFDNYPEIIFYIFGIIIIVFGFIYAIWIWIWLSLGWASILISLGIAFIAWGINKKSERIIERVEDISTDTSSMTKKIGESNFLETISVFTDRRLGLRERWGIFNQKAISLQGYRRHSNEYLIDFAEFKSYFSFTTWKCRTFIDRALVFQDKFNNKEEKRLIHQVDCLFQDLCQTVLIFSVTFNQIFPILEENQRHLQYIYNKLLTFNYFNRRDNSEYLRRYRILNNLRFLKGYSTTPIFWNR